MAEVEILIEQLASLSKLGHQYGSGPVREQMVAPLHREANHLPQGTYSERTGRAYWLPLRESPARSASCPVM